MDLTTHCDRRCPDCCCGIGINRKLQHHPWEYFEAVAPFIRGIERVNLTGGEPTIHPKFAEFVPRFKELFGCARLTMGTDGYGVVRHAKVINDHVDEVHFSNYHTKVTAAAWQSLKSSTGRLLTFDAGRDASAFISREIRGGGNPCSRGFSETVAYADGKFWPCCVSPGLDGTEGIEPCHDWREKILAVDMGCKQCMFSV
jgi:MoaA/NifB/PqqE/SkfB family radical SAM enzyme